MRQGHWIRTATCMWVVALVSLSSTAVRAQNGADEAAEDAVKKPAAGADVKMVPTEIGVRFTPAMAQALSSQFTKQIIEFAKVAKPAVPALQEFFTRSAGEIGKRLTIKQRLKFTGDMAGVTAGLVVFENRMKRWAKGEVGMHANPFYDSGDHAEDEEGEKEPVDPDETKEHRQARQHAERMVGWQSDVESQWERYVNNAIAYYELDETQVTAARAVLKDCTERAKTLKTPAWRKKVIENRIAERLGWRLDARFNQGPWKNQLDQENEKLMRPLTELGKELRGRIDGIPTSKQKAVATEAVRKALAEKGMKRLPG